MKDIDSRLNLLMAALAIGVSAAMFTACGKPAAEAQTAATPTTPTAFLMNVTQGASP